MLGTPTWVDRPEVELPAPCPPMAEVWDPPVTVAVLDTGLDPHPWFAGRPWLTEWGLQPEVLDLDTDGSPDRQAGHGTFIAGIVLRHAPGVTLRHHRVLSSMGLTDDATVAAGLRAVRQRGPVDVAVLSAGCHTVDDLCPPLLRREISLSANTVLVAAAGNSGSIRPFWPAAAPEVIAVAATAPDGELAPFSNHGPWVNTAAPGVNVVSSFVRLLPAAEGVAPGTEAREYGAARWSGTSFAAPRVAADVANLLRAGRPAGEIGTQRSLGER
jgi:subtilisin family serine protease